MYIVNGALDRSEYARVAAYGEFLCATFPTEVKPIYYSCHNQLAQHQMNKNQEKHSL